VEPVAHGIDCCSAEQIDAAQCLLPCAVLARGTSAAAAAAAHVEQMRSGRRQDSESSNKQKSGQHPMTIHRLATVCAQCVSGDRGPA
jgi:hypothetical protein